MNRTTNEKVELMGRNLKQSKNFESRENVIKECAADLDYFIPDKMKRDLFLVFYKSHRDALSAIYYTIRLLVATKRLETSVELP